MKNLIIRTISGIVYVALIVFVVLFESDTFPTGALLANLFLIVACLALWEYRNILLQKGIRLSIVFFVASVVIYCAVYAGLVLKMIDFPLVLATTAVMLCVSMFWELFRKTEQPFTQAALSVVGIFWLIFPFAATMFFPYFDGVCKGESKYLFLMVFIFLWVYDTLAYCIGSLWGKHRLFERISPKKSWEGFIGSLLLTLILAAFMPKILPILPLNIPQWLGFAFIIVVFGTLGDLFESLLKRQFEVKDSGNILPGHGGILDRFDSFLMVMPVILFYLYIIL
ncbi:MAG: phosphatidate cytidylyltransferase [Bacteroidales bacterium]|jgi:phosphatidate cytidylyltransferase|nr:phosphatidate cytidylyltransferase [Bacteroidales bacterium]